MRLIHNLHKLDEIEWGALILIIIGFVLAISTGSAMIYYIVALLAGIFFGRIWHQTKSEPQFKYFILITFFMIGFIIGNIFSRYGNYKVTIIVYLIGIAIGYTIDKQFSEKIRPKKEQSSVYTSTTSNVKRKNKV
ncbi:MAG: hypothetical protein ACMXYE_04540 [Candidatus Woesearchaeota archaeon]